MYGVVFGNSKLMYNLSLDYHWYQTPENDVEIIKVYKINNIPYSFDYVTTLELDNPEVIESADKNTILLPDDLFRYSYYLVSEMAHPLIFNLEVDDPSLLPND